MASIGHVAAGLALGAIYARDRKRRGPAVLLLAALSCVPDLDAIGFLMGVPYRSEFGHRGAAHSLVLAATLGLAGALVAWRRGGQPLRFGLFVALALATHDLMDAMTDGGLGVALAWPFSTERYFLPWRPIPVAPIGLRLLTARGFSVALWEVAATAPLFLIALWPRRPKQAPEVAYRA